MIAFRLRQRFPIVSSPERLGPNPLGRLFVAVLMFAAFLGGGAFQQAQAAELVPFRATFALTAVGSPCPPSFCIQLSGEGNATHLGRIEVSKNTISTLTGRTCANGGRESQYVATFVLTAANGDTLTLSGGGISCDAGPGGITASGSHIVTDGTGRFEGATGSISESFSGVFPSLDVILSGSISSPGSAK